jgi:hypothetical protein
MVEGRLSEKTSLGSIKGFSPESVPKILLGCDEHGKF